MSYTELSCIFVLLNVDYCVNTAISSCHFKSFFAPQKEILVDCVDMILLCFNLFQERGTQDGQQQVDQCFLRSDSFDQHFQSVHDAR